MGASARETAAPNTENTVARRVHAGERGEPGQHRDTKPGPRHEMSGVAARTTLGVTTSVEVAGEVATELAGRHLPSRRGLAGSCGGCEPPGVGIIRYRPVLPARAGPGVRGVRRRDV